MPVHLLVCTFDVAQIARRKLSCFSMKTSSKRGIQSLDVHIFLVYISCRFRYQLQYMTLLSCCLKSLYSGVVDQIRSRRSHSWFHLRAVFAAGIRCEQYRLDLESQWMSTKNAKLKIMKKRPRRIPCRHSNNVT